MYYHGNGVPKDYVEAVRWYRESAKRVHADFRTPTPVIRLKL
jgi:TPR repeat protein